MPQSTAHAWRDGRSSMDWRGRPRRSHPKPGSVGPLHGVSMTVKDLLDVKGLDSTAGSRQLADVDAWMLPVLPIAAPPHVEPSTPIDVDGEQRDYWQVFTANSFPFNVTGHPATTLPAGMSASGLPIGLQFVGRRHTDRQLLTLAAAVEALIRFDTHPD
jgi:Asp-tRNA(Asn)/Glu-tRNA(Gln) amidotransferase A subunit family amidase